MCRDSPANGVPSTARRARVFLRTRRYTPDLRAFARSSVMRPTSRPRYSAPTTVFAFANCAETSATIAFFLSRSRPKVYLQFVKSRPSSRLAAPTATLHSGKSCMGFAICVGRKERLNIDFSCPLNLSVPTVFDNPAHAVRAVRWPKVLSSISMLRRRAAAKAPHVHAHPRPHGRGDRHLAQVESLHVGRLRLVDRFDQGHQVVAQLLRRERSAPDGALNDAGLVGAVLHLAGAGVFHRRRDIGRHGPHLRVGHQPAGPQDLTQLPDHAHRVGTRDHDVKIELPGLDAFGEILHADDVRTRVLCRLGLVALCKHGDPYLLARSRRQHDRSAHGLVRFLRVDAEIDRHVDGFIELRERRLLDDLQRVEHRVIPVVLAQLRPSLLPFRELAHFTPSTVTPIERALPAIVRTAASRSAAVRSGILALAISSACARVILPTFSVCGVLLPLSIPAAFLISTVAGGVLTMKLKLLSAYAVITTGSIRPGSVFCVCALNALQNSMMFRPRWPSAGPIGGLGLALPAGTCSLMKPTTFLAISLS